MFFSLSLQKFIHTHIYIYKSLRKKNSDFLKKKLNNMSDCSDAVKDGNCFFVKKKNDNKYQNHFFFYRVPVLWHVL